MDSSQQKRLVLVLLFLTGSLPAQSKFSHFLAIHMLPGFVAPAWRLEYEGSTALALLAELLGEFE